jgi:DNA uptake protein ComE-like DNA-binding protein
MLRLEFRPVLLAFLVVSPICFGACSNNNQTVPVNSATPAQSPVAASAPTPGAANTPTAKLNVNTASGADLMSTIPNFSNRMVHEFEEYRPYRSIQVFRREIGKYVPPAVVAEYEKYIFVPIDINQSDAPTLMQIPGLDQSEAQSLIAGRPYASPEAFITKLSDKVSASELETARTHLNQP